MNKLTPSFITETKCLGIVKGMEKIIVMYCPRRKVITRQPVLIWNGMLVQDEQNVSFTQPKDDPSKKLATKSAPSGKVLASAKKKASAKERKVVKAAVMPSRDDKVYKRSQNCKECTNCQRDNCGRCRCCLDMPLFGGPGTGKQRCSKRRCFLLKKWVLAWVDLFNHICGLRTNGFSNFL